MAKYIDKSALIAEIERLREEEYPCDTFEESTGYYNALDEVSSFLNTLEVKEVNSTDAFTEKATSYIQQHWIWNTKMIEDFKNYMKGGSLRYGT